MMREIAQQQELAQMEQHIGKLKAISQYLAQYIQFLHNINELEYNQFEHYSQILEEQVDTVLLYQKIAQYWPQSSKQRTQELLEQVIVSHQYLRKLLQQQCELLYQKIQNIDLPQKTLGYSTAHNIGQMFDLKG